MAQPWRQTENVKIIIFYWSIVYIDENNAKAFRLIYFYIAASWFNFTAWTNSPKQEFMQPAPESFPTNN